MNNLHEAGNLGDIDVKNRVFMAPLTRNRAYPDGTPHEMATEYYAQRASAGLIISEATQINPLGKGYLNTPGIHESKQANAWQAITDNVHKNDGKIVLQLWHVGRISHNSLLPAGRTPLAPSAIRANAQTFTANGFENVSDPMELSINEIEGIVSDYAHAAKLAIDSGFDGVEVHGANGYLLNQFISTNANNRNDKYGGNAENRSRLLVDVVDAVSKEVGNGKVGVRLSPTGKFNDIDDEQINETYPHLYSEMAKRNLAYLHVVERFPGTETSQNDELFVRNLRREFKGNYIANGGYDRESASNVLDEGAFAVSFGRMFISNPDLPERFRKEVDLAEPDQETFYGGDEKGYTSYPSLEAA
ncbi:MAG: alkene reductase [Stappiaceae bacterium]